MSLKRHAAGAQCEYPLLKHQYKSWAWQSPQTERLRLSNRYVIAMALGHAGRSDCISWANFKNTFFTYTLPFTYIKSKQCTCSLPFLKVYTYSCAITVTVVSVFLELTLLHYVIFSVHCQTWPFFSHSATPSYSYFSLTKIGYHGMQTAENI